MVQCMCGGPAFGQKCRCKVYDTGGWEPTGIFGYAGLAIYTLCIDIRDGYRWVRNALQGRRTPPHN